MNAAASPTRAEVEDFLFHEAELLDQWRLPDWLKLVEPGGTYTVPSPDMDEDTPPDNALNLIADDYLRIEQRVLRLMKKTAHSEWPRPKTLHLVANVRLKGMEGEAIRAHANFITYRTKDSVTSNFMGESRYLLVPHEGSFRIRSKRCVLAVNNLRGPGKLGILL